MYIISNDELRNKIKTPFLSKKCIIVAQNTQASIDLEDPT